MILLGSRMVEFIRDLQSQN